MVKSKDLKNRRKGNFLSPEIYDFAKSNKKEFINTSNNKFLNIRSSTYLKKFADCTFKIHNGRIFLINDPLDLKLIFRDYPYYNFKLGQFTYNKQLVNRGYIHNSILEIIATDLKKKKGIYIKNNKKKKYIYKGI